MSAPPRSAAEFDAYIDRVARGSKVTGALAVAGLLLVLGAMVFSTSRLVKIRQELATVQGQVTLKRAALDTVMLKLRVATDSMARLDAGAKAVTALIERQRSPALTAAAIAARDSAVAAKVVYIQFRGTLSRAVANELRDQLNSGGFNAPGVERIDRQYRNSVRYFHPQDSAAAGVVARVTSAFFTQRGCAAEFPVQAAGARGAPEGQVEIWINLNCTPAASPR